MVGEYCEREGFKIIVLSKTITCTKVNVWKLSGVKVCANKDIKLFQFLVMKYYSQI